MSEQQEPTMGLLEELAVRCEAATGADREIDLNPRLRNAGESDGSRLMREDCEKNSAQWKMLPRLPPKMVEDRI